MHLSLTVRRASSVLLVAAFFLLSGVLVSSKKCTGPGNARGQCTEPSKCSEPHILSDATECVAPLVCCKTSGPALKWTENPLYSSTGPDQRRDKKQPTVQVASPVKVPVDEAPQWHGNVLYKKQPTVQVASPGKDSADETPQWHGNVLYKKQPTVQVASPGKVPDDETPQWRDNVLFKKQPSLQVASPGTVPDETKFLLIDADDDKQRMENIRGSMTPDAWRKLDVVKLNKLDFDDLKQQIRGLGRVYPVVIFTMHGRNQGHATPSVSVAGYRASNHLVAEKVVKTSPSTTSSEQTVVNPLHLSDQSWENFQNADPERPYSATYRLGYLRVLYDVVKDWQPKPLVFLSVCNDAGGALQFRPVPNQARTGVEVYYPRQCFSSSQILDAQIWEELMARGNLRLNAGLFNVEYQLRHNAQWDHNDMAKLIDLSKREGE